MRDQQTEFNSIYVIESLRPDEYRTGKNLYREVLLPAKEHMPWLEANYSNTPDRTSFWRELEHVRERARCGRLPVLHLEAHGTRAGIHLADGSIVPWSDLRGILTEINEFSRFRLLVVMALCKGAFLASALQPPMAAPAWAVIGSRADVENLDLEAGMWLQYEALLAQQHGDDALRALNEQQSESSRFEFLSAEQLFHSAVSHFFSHRSADIVQAHEHLIVATKTKEWGYDLRVAMRARDYARRMLSDERYWYDCWRTDFLMLDKFPENAKRFVLTYDDYLRSRPAVR